MIDRVWAENFAKEWIEAWNNFDLNAILAHYADNVVFHSPRIAVVTGERAASVAGKEALARYWSKALQGKNLRFNLERVYVGSDSLSISYRNQRAQHVVETFVFDDAGLVKESVAAYA
ncbi:MAG: nuclear transport factor 2 family protein [Alphaproteobacteria bacterium]|nr:nuclear transport factor 2 family protein [Alphaproteobacteria bacterium]